MDFAHGREDWEHRYGAWKEQKDKKKTEAPVVLENRERLREYNEVKTVEIQEAKKMNIFNIREIIENRKALVLLIIIILVIVGVIFISVG